MRSVILLKCAPELSVSTWSSQTLCTVCTVPITVPYNLLLLYKKMKLYKVQIFRKFASFAGTPLSYRE